MDWGRGQREGRPVFLLDQSGPQARGVCYRDVPEQPRAAAFVCVVCACVCVCVCRVASSKNEETVTFST